MRAKLIILIIATVAVVAFGFAADRDDDGEVDTAAGSTTSIDDPAKTANDSLGVGTTLPSASTTVPPLVGKPTIFVTNTGATTIVLGTEGSQYRVRTPCGPFCASSGSSARKAR